MDAATRRLADDWVALWNGDLTQTRRIVAEGFVAYAAPLMGGAPGATTGRDALDGWVRGIHAVLSDLRFTVQLGPFCDGDTVVLRWRADGTYAGGVPGATAPAGGAVEFFGTDTLRIDDDGLIAEYWANADSLWFAQQIGLGAGAPPRLPRTSSGATHTTIAAALHDLLNTPELPLDQAVSRHFSDDYRQRTDGSWDDRAGFLAHMAHLRSVVAHVTVEVKDEVTDGRTYAERHVVTVRKRDGSDVVQEVSLFGTLAPDGRFARVEEVTMMLDGAEADRRLGSAR